MPRNAKKFLGQKRFEKIFADEKGIIVIENITPEFSQCAWEATPLIDMFHSAGYRFVTEDMALNLAISFAGRSIDELRAEIQKRAVKCAAMRERRDKERKKWANHVDNMSNMVIGIGSTDLFETGFHIWLLLNTQYTYQQQRDYIRDRHEDIIRFIQNELQSIHKRGWKKLAKLMPYTDLVSIIPTTQNCVQYTYELKENLRERLKGMLLA